MRHATMYVICADKAEAEKVAQMLLKKRLVACANIVPEIESVYWWKGKIQKDKEVLIFGKTEKKKAERIVGEVKKMHSYDVPCITFMPIVGGNKDYLHWVSGEVEE